MIDRRFLTFITLLCTCIWATAGGQEHEHSRTVIGPANIDLADGAEALLAGDAEKGVSLTERGLQAAANDRERGVCCCLSLDRIPEGCTGSVTFEIADLVWLQVGPRQRVTKEGLLGEHVRGG